MTQASLSPELPGALGAPPSMTADEPSPGVASEGALWAITLTASGLLVAAVLLVGLLAQGAVVGIPLGAFFLAAAIVITALGVGSLAFALVAARRAGYLHFRDIEAPSASAAVPAGMHVVPALPADRGRHMRQRLQDERDERNRQARAIAAASVAATRTPRAPLPAVIPPAAPRPTSPAIAAARPLQAAAPRPAATHNLPHVSIRGGHASSTAPSRRFAALAPTEAALGTSRAITMPRPIISQPRPAAWPDRVPVVRMAAAPMRPRTQVATFQVAASNVRAVPRHRYR